ncbi:MAG: ornithine cyclodeaminase family protein [Betaproteobacteria bacterium]|nr:ornithine cyclodeaminase family protein [Betaproteobacteria bacterium]
MTLLITEDDVRKLALSAREAIPIVEDTFRQAGEGSAENPPRFRMPFRNGFLQFGPAALHARKAAGFKLWANMGKGTGVHKNASGHGTNFLYDTETGELLAIVHAYQIGKFRTSAVSAVAAKYLSPAGASAIGLYSAGRIAEGQLDAVCAVRPIKKVRVYSRRQPEREAFCKRMSERLGIDVFPADAPEEVPRDADIVITASTSEVPILFGDWLTRPALVIAAGANHWYKREIDGKVIEKAQLVVCDEKEQSRVESGNLLWAVAHGIITWDRVEELGDVIAGRVRLPDVNSATIVFGSHGLAINDVAMTLRTYELAKAMGIGTEIDLG